MPRKSDVKGELEMFRGKIEFTGESLEDVQAAVEEALRRIVEQEMTSGFDRNTSGGFEFEVENG